MDPDCLPLCFDQRIEITQRLRTDERTERQPFGGNVEILFGVGGDDQEQAVLDAAFVELPRGMLKAGTETSGHGVARLRTYRDAHFLERIAFISSFLVSFDEPVVVLFISGANTRTLPRQLFDEIKYNLDPTAAAISGLLILLSIAVNIYYLFLKKKN